MPTLTTASLTLHYVDEGPRDAPVLVWAPGDSDFAAMVPRAHERLLDRYRIVAIDPRGQGGTTAFVAGASFAPTLLPEDWLALFDALGLEQAVIGGHTRGALAALHCARAVPERVRAVAAVAPPVLSSNAADRLAYRKAAERLRTAGLEPYLARLPGGPRNPEWRAAWEAHLRALGAEAVAAEYEALADLQPVTEDTARLTMPVLIICGQFDRLLADAQVLAPALPRAHLSIIPDAGHVPFQENKAAYFAVLERFLAEVTGA